MTEELAEEQEREELAVERKGLTLTLYCAYEAGGILLPRDPVAHWVGRIVLDEEPGDWDAVRAYSLPGGQRRRIWVDGLHATPGRLILPYDGRWQGQDSRMTFCAIDGAKESPVEIKLDEHEADAGERPYVWRPGDGTAHLVLDHFSGGSGTQLDPYIIANVTELQAMEDDLAAYYALGGAIDASATSGWNGSTGFAPIGQASPYFTGELDGADYTITGLTINRPTTDHVGLIGVVHTGGVVKNVGLVANNIQGGKYTGALVGHVITGTTQDCYSTGSVDGTESVGGIAGFTVTTSTVQDCYATGNVAGTLNVGGVVGWLHASSTIQDCYSTGSVDGTTSVGGVAGRVYYSTITRSYSTGSVTGTTNVGGVAGNCLYHRGMQDCYSTGSVTGTTSVGGVAGYTESDIVRCYSTGDVDGNLNVGGAIGWSVGAYADVDDVWCANSVTATGVSPTKIGAFCGLNGSDAVLTRCYYWAHVGTVADAVGQQDGTGTPSSVVSNEYFWTYGNEPYPQWDFLTLWDPIGDGILYPVLRYQHWSISYPSMTLMGAG